MPRQYEIQGKPADYLTNPLETWSVRQLTDALGYTASAKVLGTTAAAVRQMRHRGSTSQARFAQLQAAVRADEDFFRKTLVSRYSNRRPS